MVTSTRNRTGWAGRVMLLVLVVAAGLAGVYWLRGGAIVVVRPMTGPIGVVPSSPTTLDCQLTDVTAPWGIRFVHDPGPPTLFFPEIVASGLAVLDFDRDGLLDIYFRSATSAAPHPAAQADSPRSTSRLFRQIAVGRFEDVTEKAGLGDGGYGMGVAVGDVNNDGYVDVYNANFGGGRLFLNRRDGTFVDVTESAGTTHREWGSSAAFVDVDRDGRLDLFVTNYVDYSRPKSCSLTNGRVDYCAPREFPGTHDNLYHNVTDVQSARDDPSAVRFQDITAKSGIATVSGPGLGVRPCDVNDDGWPDLYVANDGSANFLWINQRDGTFQERGVPMGVAYNTVGTAAASMGIAEGDIDGDHAPDLVVTNLRAEASNLFRRANSGYDDVAGNTGIQRASYPHTGFGISMADVDHDGDLDIAVANGHVYQPIDRPILPAPGRASAQMIAQFWRRYADSNQLLLNDGRGQFEEASQRTGDFAREMEPTRSLATGDLDGDGDLDFVINSTASPGRVYRNDVQKHGHWLMLRVLDPTHGGRDAYGARVTVFAGSRRWTGVVQPASSYQTSDDSGVHFGLGAVTQIERIEVRWPDGDFEPEVFRSVTADQKRTLQRQTGARKP